MGNYIYYPGFEVRDEVWLKFALLYLERIHPIIPSSGDRHLNEAYTRLVNETDLIEPHRPTEFDAYRASEKALTSIERFYELPQKREKWQNPSCHNYRLFREKYTGDFSNFCISNGLASPCAEGLYISEELAFSYMTHLAVAVGREQQLPVITDFQRYDRISNTFVYGRYREAATNNAARYMVSLALPVNIYDISLQEIIDIRNSRGYGKMLEAFNKELKSYLATIGEREPSIIEFDSYLSTKAAIAEYITQKGLVLATVALGTYLIFDNPTIGLFVKETLLRGASLLTDSIFSFKTLKAGTADKRNASRFLTFLNGVRR
jgi:hypothetical protein